MVEEPYVEPSCVVHNCLFSVDRLERFLLIDLGRRKYEWDNSELGSMLAMLYCFLEQSKCLFGGKVSGLLMVYDQKLINYGSYGIRIK